MREMAFSLLYISVVMLDIIPFLLFVTSLGKVQSMRELFTLTRFLSRKQYVLFRIVDAGTFVLSLTFICSRIVLVGLDSCTELNKFFHLEVNSTLATFVRRTSCLNEFFLMFEVQAFCALYILLFMVVFFVKVTQLDEMSSNRPSMWRRNILPLSSRVGQLGEKLDDSTSFILFFQVAHEFFSVSLLFLLAMMMSQKVYGPEEKVLIVILCELLSQLLLTALLFLCISLMQEKVQRKCECLCRRIIYSASLSGTMHEDVVMTSVLTSDFNHKVTVWKLVEVSRAIILTLASVYVAFPVLCWQVNNGALGTLRFS